MKNTYYSGDGVLDLIIGLIVIFLVLITGFILK
jgi:uncharacterized membrane protein